MESLRPRRALISVSDKTGLVPFAEMLAGAGIELISTGGTAAALRAAGLSIMEVAEITGFPEMMDGRVKTLHPRIHGGLLALRDKADHQEAMQREKIPAIDLLVSNLYPFEATVAAGAAFDALIEEIDIGGPALIRAAAKNHKFVCVVTDIADYAQIKDAMAAHDGQIPAALRRELAAKAFARTAAYDAAIANWFAHELKISAPGRRVIAGTLKQTLRYGENPHQSGAFYVTGGSRPSLATARQIQGKELSYNNIADSDAAFELISEFAPDDGAAVAIIKHANPCGVAAAESLGEAYRLALRADPVSAFGGVIALNRELDLQTAELISELFTEVIIAPAASEEAIRLLAKKRNLRLLLTGGLADPAEAGLTFRSVTGGFLVQTRDNYRVGAADMTVVTKRAPAASEMRDLHFAFLVAKHVKSNAIVYARDRATVGIGAGQMSRLDSSRIAARKGEDAAEAAGLALSLTQGSVVASDAFFPFPDGLLAAIEAGATAVIQPGGSIRDSDVIAAADERGIAMVFTGIRHFRH